MLNSGGRNWASEVLMRQHTGNGGRTDGRSKVKCARETEQRTEPKSSDKGDEVLGSLRRDENAEKLNGRDQICPAGGGEGDG